MLRAAERRADHSLSTRKNQEEGITLNLLMLGAVTRGHIRSVTRSERTPHPTEKGSAADLRSTRGEPAEVEESDGQLSPEENEEVIYPRRDAREALRDKSSYGSIPNALTRWILILQSKDDWCRTRGWEAPKGEFFPQDYLERWTIDQQGLVLCDGRVFIPKEPATRAEILRKYHDDP